MSFPLSQRSIPIDNLVGRLYSTRRSLFPIRSSEISRDHAVDQSREFVVEPLKALKVGRRCRHYKDDCMLGRYGGVKSKPGCTTARVRAASWYRSKAR
jgi:hypothetical protein